MKFIQAFYNPKHNSIDINHYDGYIIRIDYSKVEKGLNIIPEHEGILDALAIDKPLEYAVMYLEGAFETAQYIKFDKLNIKRTNL